MSTDLRSMLVAGAMAGLLAGCAGGEVKTEEVKTEEVKTEEVKTEEVKPADTAAAAHDTAAPAEGTQAATVVPHECATKNECKGQGGCKTGDQGCAGKNTCKGKGGCKSS